MNPEKPPQENPKLEGKIGEEETRRIAMPSAQEIFKAVGELNISVGDKIISKSGTERVVTEFDLRKGHFKVQTKKGGYSKSEILTFRDLFNAKNRGTINRIEHVEEK